MARIRSIKPEFPQSESMGRVSRDARLLFILLWPICDDHGRTRAASRMLASLLFPYDEDAGKKISGWLKELQDEGCIRLYEAEGSTYLEVCNWLKHQKIDKPSKPQFPSFGEDSRDLASIREDSSLEGKGREGKGEEGRRRRTHTKTDLPPDFGVSDNVKAWASEKGHCRLDDHLESFRSKCQAKGYQYANWDAAFMGAIRDNWANLPSGSNGASPGGGRKAL